MSFSVRVYAKKNGEELWEVDQVSWWDTDKLARDPRFHEKDMNPSYRDYIADISPREAIELENQFECPFEWWFPRRDSLREKLQSAATDPNVVIRVHVYEWESGM